MTSWARLRVAARLVLALTSAACQPIASPSPPVASVAPTVDPILAAALEEAIRFRMEFGLRSDEPFVRSVFSDPTHVDDFGVPLLPEEAAELHHRASAASDVAAVVRAYGALVPGSFAGVYIDETGWVHGLFVGDLSAPRAAIQSKLSPAAKFQVRPAEHTLKQLDDFLAAVSLSQGWFESVGAPFRGGSVRVEENDVWLILGGVPSAGLESVYEHFDVEPSLLTITVDPEALSKLPRGRVEGTVVDPNGNAVLGQEFDLVAVGDIADYEPDGGVGISTGRDGTFVIPKLAQMGWRISVRDPATGDVLGETHVSVVGGETAQVRIVLTP